MLELLHNLLYMCVRYKWNGKTRTACDNARHLPSKSLVLVCIALDIPHEGQCPSQTPSTGL